MKMPTEVTIFEVGPRDGLQNVQQFLETEDKIKLIKLLARSGLKEIEVTSFVSPKRVHQFRDAREICAGLKDLAGINVNALVPNLIGAKNALECGVERLAFVLSVSESHNMSNVNKTRDESLAELDKILALKKEEFARGLTVRVVLSTVFGCPFEGEIKPEELLRHIKRIEELGVSTVILADTVGYGTPTQVRSIVKACLSDFPAITLGAHFHNTRGLGLANALVCLEEGIGIFDSSIGGLGGCPFVPNATGNISTEDLVFMLNGMGIKHGVDIERLFEATRFIKNALPGISLSSSVFQAGLPRKGGGIC